MKIDMHAHWRPAALIEPMRARTTEPRIVKNAAGVEVIKTRNTEEPVATAFDDAQSRLAEMDRQGITTAVLSMLGQYSWTERLPAEEGLPLLRLYNDSVSALCKAHPGRFAAYACVPQTDVAIAAEEFERAIKLPGIIGVIMPGNAFATRKAADKVRPIMEVAERHRAVVFIHNGPLPGDAWPKVGNDTDNARRRNGTLDMQASLSSAMVTLCLTDYLDAFPNAKVHVHNLGGNIPYEVERMDHRCLLDTPDEELPSKRFARSKVLVDCNSFGARAIEAGVRLYGAERIIFGTDGTEFGCDWSSKAVAEAEIGAEAKEKILHRNAVALFGHKVAVARAELAAA
ncbi:MAG: amidohydrolase family protein [Burkholderiales bacterium]